MAVDLAQLAQFNRERDEMVETQMQQARIWDRELKRIDPRLSLVLAKDGSDAHDLTPGAWHVKRKGPQLDTYLPWVDENDQPLLPSSGILKMLEESDLWKDSYAKFKARREKLQEAHKRAQRLKAEQRQDHMAEAVRAALRVSGDGGMTKRLWGKK